MKRYMKKRGRGREPVGFFSPISKLKAGGEEPREQSTAVSICRAEQREGREIDVKAKGHD